MSAVLTIHQLEHKLARLRALDLSGMGFEAKVRHREQIEELQRELKKMTRSPNRPSTTNTGKSSIAKRGG